MNRLIIIACLVVLNMPGMAQEPFFQGLGDLPGGEYYSMPTGFSGDGTVVGGSSFATGNSVKQFLWTKQSGMVQFDPIFPEDLSFDGSVVVGGSSRWTADDGAVFLGSLSGSTVNGTTARAVSEDGQYVVGASASSLSPSGTSNEAFLWSSNSGIGGLGFLPGSVASEATGVSDDGTIVAGSAYFPYALDTKPEAFRWTEDTGMLGLGFLNNAISTPSNAVSSQASAVSANGTTIVGTSDYYVNTPFGPTLVQEAFRWTETDGMVGLGSLYASPTGFFLSSATDVSSDGSIIVGFNYTEAGSYRSFIWDKVNGMRDLQTVLENESNLDLAGWELNVAFGISEDGTAIMGQGTNPSGFTEAWIAQIPEPSSMVLSGIGAIAVLVFFHRKRSREVRLR